MAGGEAASSMFAGRPQPVEIHHRGLWYSGELLGWRHETDGRVSARVRCRVDGLRHSTWMDLADLRLPDPRHPPRKEPFPAVARCPVPVAADGEQDRTRPHALLAAIRTRPRKPAHAVHPPSVTPPAGPSVQPDRAPAGHPGSSRRSHEASPSAV